MCEYKLTHTQIYPSTYSNIYIYTHIHIVLFNILLIILSLQYGGMMSKKKKKKKLLRANNHIFSLELNFLVFYASLPDMSFLLHHANPSIHLQP